MTVRLTPLQLSSKKGNPRKSALMKSTPFCIIAVASSLSCMGQSNDRPNVILIFPDQMRFDALGCMGNRDVKTPHLDKFASEGVLLRQTFSNTPVSGPARADILTGRYAHANGLVANDLRLKETEVTIAEILGNEGYETGFIGKWHLDGGPKDPGYVPPHRRQGFQFWAANECNHKHFKSSYYRNDSVSIPISEFETQVWTDEAIMFLEKRSARPFFLTIAMGPPHDPYKAPEKFRQLYDTSKLTMRPNWIKGTKNGSKEDIAEYYGMVSAIDADFGRLMQELEKRNLRRNTIVLFISDHGDMLGSHGRVFKRQPWEESVRVPGIISWPAKIPGGRVCNALFSTVDVMPTLLDLCAADIPEGVQGVSLKNVILNNEKGPDAVYFSIYGPCKWQNVEGGWRGIRTHRYKYATFENKPWILYDLEADPYETNNLIGNPAFRELQQKMHAHLGVWMKKTGDTWSNNWTYPFADNFELMKAPFYSVEEFFRWKAKQPSQ